jgi:hypothetical protein
MQNLPNLWYFMKFHISYFSGAVLVIEKMTMVAAAYILGVVVLVVMMTTNLLLKATASNPKEKEEYLIYLFFTHNTIFLSLSCLVHKTNIPFLFLRMHDK